MPRTRGRTLAKQSTKKPSRSIGACKGHNPYFGRVYIGKNNDLYMGWLFDNFIRASGLKNASPKRFLSYPKVSPRRVAQLCMQIPID